MNTGAFGEGFPYTNFHDLNMDWIIKIAKDFLDQYTHLEETIANGLESLDNKTTEGLEALDAEKDRLQLLLQEWYDSHSADIAEQLADALQDLDNALDAAITSFNSRAETKALETLESIPADYTELAADVSDDMYNLSFILNSYFGNTIIPVTNRNEYIDLTGNSVTMENSRPVMTDTSYNNRYSCSVIECSPKDVFIINGKGGLSTRLYAFIDDSGNVLDKAGSNFTATNLRLIAPDGSAWLIMNRLNSEMKPSFVGFRWYTIADSLQLLGEINLLPVLMDIEQKTNSGVQMTPNIQEASFKLNGTQNNTYISFFLWSYSNGMPPNFVAGNEYFFCVRNYTNNPKLCLRLYVQHEDLSVDHVNLFESDFYTIPDDTIGMSIAIYSGTTTVTYDNEKIYATASLVSDIRRDTFKKEAEQWTATPKNILPDFADMRTKTTDVVTYRWNPDKNIVTVTGTTLQNESKDWMYSYEMDMPPQIAPDSYYKLEFIPSLPDKMFVRIFFKLRDDTVQRTTYTGSSVVHVPEDAVGITFQFAVAPETTYNNSTALVELQTVPFAIRETINGNVNTAAYIFGIGSSMLRGLVYPDGVLDHRCSFENSPYGNISLALQIPEANTEFELHGNTGLLYDAGSGNFLNLIKAKDLKKYDYVLTEINRPDLRNTIPLGTINSVAGDGTLAGAVVDLVNYMKLSNPNCQLIMVGPPPSNYASGYSYDQVFTAIYGNGYSIHDADILMHRLAVKYHFIFIDWEDLNLSYYYPDLCYQNNVHPTEDATCRAMGLYLARCLNFASSQVKILMEDLT